MNSNKILSDDAYNAGEELIDELVALVENHRKAIAEIDAIYESFFAEARAIDKAILEKAYENIESDTDNFDRAYVVRNALSRYNELANAFGAKGDKIIVAEAFNAGCDGCSQCA